MRSPTIRLRLGLRYSALGLIVISAFLLRVALVLPQVRSDFHYLQAQLYTAWGFNAAVFNRWDLVEDNIGTVLHARALEKQHLIDPVEILAEGFQPAPADRGTWNYEQPGPGWVIGLAWWVTGDYRVIWPLFLQAAGDSLAIVCLYAIAVSLWGRGPALAAALGYALFLPQAQLSAFPLYNVWSGPLLIGFIALIAWQRPGARGAAIHGAAGGLLVGVGTLFTPTFLPLGGLLAVIVAWRRGVRQLMPWIASALVALLLCLTPWAYRNYRHHGEFRPIASAFWWNLYYGLVEQEDSPFGPLSTRGWPNYEDEVFAWLRDTRGLQSWYTRESEAAIRPLVLHALREEPTYYPQVVASRLLAATMMAYHTADMTRRTEAVRNCYRELAIRVDVTLPVATCDLDYAVLNPWPAQTAWIIDGLIAVNRPVRIEVSRLWKYGPGFVNAIVLGLPVLALLGLVVGARRAPGLAAGFALTVIAWCAVYAINHLEARYVAGAQALMTAAAWGGLARLVASSLAGARHSRENSRT